MSFMTSYKKLEQLCRDITGEDRPVSAYIEEMKNTTLGSRYVPGWDDDLKKLKYYRWVRNQIVHETGKTEENMCTSLDVVWIDNFYNRILNQTDPLALYHQAMTQRNQKKTGASKEASKETYNLKVNDWYERRYNNNKAGSMLYFAMMVIVLIVALTICAQLFSVFFF